MAFYSYRAWSDRKNGWVYGKRHWLVSPRRTVCGREATADWFKSEDTLGFFSSNDCRQCFFGWSKSGR